MSGRLIYVMGPSGAGKDTLLGFAREHMDGAHALFAHRYITREAGAGGENHIALTPAEFVARSKRNLFALEWNSHRLYYGIGIEIDTWLERGLRVVINGSRAHLPAALARYPSLLPVLIDAAPEVLAQRLLARGRENAAAVSARLAHRPSFEADAHEELVRIDNSGEIEVAGMALVEVLCG